MAMLRNNAFVLSSLEKEDDRSKGGLVASDNAEKFQEDTK
jgi:hypothetical protein